MLRMEDVMREDEEYQNTYRHLRVVLDETKDVFVKLLEFHLSKVQERFYDFILKNAHSIYHYCHGADCCQCECSKCSNKPPKCRCCKRQKMQRKTILHASQLKILFDEAATKIPGHDKYFPSHPKCCSPVKPSLSLSDLDITLARFLLVKFTTVVLPGTDERKALDELVEMRNTFAHAAKCKMSKKEYQESISKTEQLLVLADIYGKKAETKDRLVAIRREPMNVKICIGLLNTLLLEAQIDKILFETVNNLNKMITELTNVAKKIPAYIVKDIENTTVIEGVDACFEIWLKDGNTPVKWFQNDFEITTGGNKNVIKNQQMHTLRIGRCSQKEKGIYGVQIKDILPLRTALLNVKDYYTRNLQDITCTEGDDVDLNCEILFCNMSAKWYKDGTCINDEGKQRMITDQNCHKMIIEGVEMADSGLYEIDIQGRKRSARLTVESFFTRNLEAMTCTEGDSVTFVCEVKTDNTIAKWFQNYNEIETSPGIVLETSERQHKLTIEDTIARDSGEYSVVVKKSKRKANLSVKSYFTKPLDLFTRTVGDTVTFSCEVVEENTTAKWFLNDIEIQPSSDKEYQTSGRQHALIIKNISDKDGGKYSVIVNGRKSRGALRVEATGTLQKCELCVSDPKYAVYRCTECKQSICRECTNIHRTQPKSSTHTIVLFCSDYQLKLKIKRISDIACLYNREMMIVDEIKKQLILSDITGDNKQYIPLPYTPVHLFVIDHNTVAVTSYINKVVFIVDVRKRIVRKQIDIKKVFSAIMYRNNYLYVGCEDKSLVVVDMSGETICTVQLSFEPWCICSGTEERIYCTDFPDNNVYCIDTEGTTIFTVTNPDMSETSGITTDHEGNILVVCHKSNNILKISPDGKQCNVLITDIPSSECITCIFYDLVSKSIVVGRDGTIYFYKA